MTFTFNKVTMTPDELANWQSQWSISQWCDLKVALAVAQKALAPLGGVGEGAVAIYDSTIFYEACCDYRARRAGASLFGDSNHVVITLYDVKRGDVIGQRATLDRMEAP